MAESASSFTNEIDRLASSLDQNANLENISPQHREAKPTTCTTAKDQPEAEVAAIFTPLKMGNFELPHRLVHAPLTRCRAIGTIPQKNMVDYYRQRAQGAEGGFIIAEASLVSQEGHGLPNTPGIYTQEQITAWAEVVKAVKETGNVFFLQLWHAGRSGHSECNPNKAPVVSSSATAQAGDVMAPDGWKPHQVPIALDKPGIQKIIEDYKQATCNALEAGFDGVEIHSGNGYLLDQFLKPKPNQRNDEYGGSVENRCRFPLEVVRAVVAVAGGGRVGLRLSPYENHFGDVSDPDPNATFMYMVKQLEGLGLAYLHMIEPRISGYLERQIEDKSFGLQPYRAAFEGVFMAAGGYNRGRAIENLKHNPNDLMSFGRHYLSNPDLPKRYRLNANLNPYKREFFYCLGDEGYLDYPLLDKTE